MFVVGCFCSIFSFLWVTMICLLYIQVRTCSLLFYINDRKKQRQREKEEMHIIYLLFGQHYFSSLHTHKEAEVKEGNHINKKERERGEKKKSYLDKTARPSLLLLNLYLLFVRRLFSWSIFFLFE